MKEQGSTMMRMGRNIRIVFFILAFILVAVVAHYTLRVFVYDTFIVKGESMEPTFHDGSRVWVNKLRLGARIYTSYDFTKSTMASLRLTGFSHINAGDIVVANYPYARSKDTISFRINYVCLKRCYGAPGDTVRIRNGYYEDPHTGGHIGNIAYQKKLSEISDSMLLKMGVVLKALQVNKKLGWTIRDFGPMCVPKRGDVVNINIENYRTWIRLILFETGGRLSASDGQVFLDGDPITEYQFKGNWYFLGGDNVFNSRDSRYSVLFQRSILWGLWPLVLGKMQIIRNNRRNL